MYTALDTARTAPSPLFLLFCAGAASLSPLCVRALQNTDGFEALWVYFALFMCVCFGIVYVSVEHYQLEKKMQLLVA